MIQKLLSLGGKCIGWLLVGFFLFMTLGSFVSASPVAGVLNLIAAALCAPIGKLKQLKSKIKLNTVSSLLLALVLLVTSTLMLPRAESPQQPELPDTPVISTENKEPEAAPAPGVEAPAEKPAETPIEQPTEKPVDSPIEKPAETPTEKPAETPAEKPTEAPTTETVTPVTPAPEAPKEEAPVVAPPAPQTPPIAEEKPEEIPVDSTFSIHYIDVGQADAALVECDGHYMLIDGGNKADSNVIYSVLKSAGANHLDMVVGTHAHEDHIGGLPGAYNFADVDLTLCPVTSYDSDAFGDFKKYAGTLTVPKVGDSYELGSADVKILGVNGSSDVNDTSIILKITYGEISFLFTGDAEYNAEQAVLSRGADLSATILKVGHHGSDTSTGYQFLREIMPEYAIISCGKGNSYGHPTDTVLSRLRDADVKVYRTDLNGDVFVTSDGKTVSVSSDKTASNDAIMTPGSTATSKPATTTPAAPTAPVTPSAPAAPATPPAVTPPKEETSAPTPVGMNYVLNINPDSMRFHYPDCGSVKKMKSSNRKDVVSTRDKLIAEGYIPCGNCKP